MDDLFAALSRQHDQHELSENIGPVFWLFPIVGAFVADKWLRAIVNLPLRL
jgi:hypothetical protein